ncbi:MAG TPA: hypothetical protein VLZ78_06125, partial [Terrimesophilobacter sp.]|nr:hypothetical protein [Terrimesophilobacter sp.]
MSAQQLKTTRGMNGGTLVPFQAGHPGNPGGLTKAEREWRAAVDAELIPLAKDLALAVYKRAMRDAESDRLASGEKNPFGGAGPTYASL